METGTLGTTLRTLLALVVAGTAVAVAELWRMIAANFAVSAIETTILVSPVAAVGLACAYFAAHG